MFRFYEFLYCLCIKRIGFLWLIRLKPYFVLINFITTNQELQIYTWKKWIKEKIGKIG